MPLDSAEAVQPLEEERPDAAAVGALAEQLG
jgi:hypothetical protein